MTETLELPDGTVLSPDDVFLYNDYPYRFVPTDETESAAFLLSPLYWGGGEMDVPFAGHDELREQWIPDQSGDLDRGEWEQWLGDARADDTFDDAEIDALAAEILGDAESAATAATDEGLLSRIRSLLHFGT